MGETALLIFTVSVQAAVGIMVFVAIGNLLQEEGNFKMPIVLAALLAGIGVLASFLHLGRPLSALNSLANFGSSWLSREIWLTGLFTGVTVLAALAVYFKAEAKGAIKALTLTAAALGLLNVFAMASVYTSTIIDSWQGAGTYVEFYAATLSIGALLFYALKDKEMVSMQGIVFATAITAVFIQIVISFTGYQATDFLAVIKLVSILAGAVLIATFAKKEEIKAPVVLIAAVLITFGQIIGRYLFFTI